MAAAARDGAAAGAAAAAEEGKSSKGKPTDGLNPMFIKQFDKLCSSADEQLTQVATASGKIEALTKELAAAIDDSHDTKLRAELTKNVKESQLALTNAKKTLMQIKKDGEELEGSAEGMAAAQVLIPRYKALLRRYMNELKRNQQAKMGFKSAATEKLTGQARLMPEFDSVGDSDLRDQLERDPSLLTKTIQDHRMAGETVEFEFRQAQARARDVELLVRSIEEVFEMTKELGELVAMQDEKIDSIVENTTTALHYVQQGNKSLSRGLEKMKATRKKMCCFIIIAVVLLIVVSGLIGGLVST